jgi:DNA-binding transcriptional LysR family regulator
MAFARDLQPFLAAAAVLNSHRKRVDEGEPTYRYKIYVGLSLLENYVRPKLDQFQKANPDIDLEFQADAPGPETRRKIREDRFDFALLHLTSAEDLDEPARILTRCRAGIYAHRSLLPADGRTLSTEEIANLPFVLPRPGTEQEKGMLDALERSGIRPNRIVGRSQYFDVLSGMVEHGVGVTLLCEAMIRPEMRSEVGIALPFMPFRLTLRTRPTLRGPAVRAVEKFLADAVLKDPRYPALEDEASETIRPDESKASADQWASP